MILRRTLAALWAVLVFSGVANAGSPVWKISGPGTHLYIGGTFHILADSDYPLPKAFDRAYEDAKILVFETDLSAMGSPEFTQEMMGQMVYPDNRSLKTLLEPATYAALYRYAGDRGIAGASLDKFKPGLVMTILTLTEIQRLGQTGTGVDQYYLDKATGHGRPLRFLESPMDQVKFLAGIGLGNEEAIMKYILKDLNQLPTLWPALKKSWRAGDLEAMFVAAFGPMKQAYPEIYQSLLTQRNQAWMIDIKEMLATSETEFILVGAGHLTGEDGLLTLLKAAGFTAENLQ